MDVSVARPRSLAICRHLALQTIQRNIHTYRGDLICQPSPTYQGFWARDTMVIALGLLDAGKISLGGGLLRAWAHYQIHPDDDPARYVLLNKHRLEWTESETETPGRQWLEENRGGLPTCVYVGRNGYADGTREIYCCHPDPDSTAWWLVACGRYAELSGNDSAIEDLLPHLQAAMDALVRRDSDGDCLIEQCPNEDWADHMRRHGKVTYTQAVWYGAVRAARALGLEGPDPAVVREDIRAALLSGRGKALDWRCPRAKSERVAQDSALLALMGVLDNGEAGRLLRRLDALAGPHGHRIVSPAFRSSQMGPYHFKRGEYQNGAIWTWLTGWEAQARALGGEVDAAEQLVRDSFCPTCDRVYEWINPRTGDRYNADFATGAGSLLSAMARIDA